MNKMLSFSGRTAKEILRDPLNLAFGIGFPVILLLLLSAIQANIPVEMFVLSNLTPGITVFGLSFMTLFSALLLAKDRESAFLQRLYTTPLTALDVIFGYLLPLLPISLAQGVLTYLVAFLLGWSPPLRCCMRSCFCSPLRCFLSLWGCFAEACCRSSRWAVFAALC